MKKADIGLIGLAVMGENLVLNMESHGFTVAVYNRTTSKVDDFVNGRGADKNIIGTHSLEELCASLERPRRVMIMVKAGAPVDRVIESLEPYLEEYPMYFPMLRTLGFAYYQIGDVKRARQIAARCFSPCESWEG